MADKKELQRCVFCGDIPLVRIHTPQEYMMCLDSFMRMVNAGTLQIVYQSCPLDKVIVDGKFYKRKLFHQFKCGACGAIYGMYVDAEQGGEIKQNEKIFVPADYDDK